MARKPPLISEHIKSPPEHVTPLRVLGHEGIVTRVGWSPDGRHLASTTFRSSQDKFSLWDPTTGELVRKIGFERLAEIYDFGWAPDSRRAAICSEEVLCVVDVETGSIVWRFDGKALHGIAWDPSGRLIAVGSRKGVISILDAQCGELKQSLSVQQGSVTELAWSPDGGFLAGAGAGTGESRYDIRVWESASGAVVPQVHGHTGFVADLAWSPVAPILASVSEDRTIRIWDTGKGQLAQTIEVHTNFVRGIAFSPDGRALVSNSWDNTVRIWRADDFSQLAVMKLAEDGGKIYNRVAFSPDGKMFAASQAQNVFLFSIDLDALLGGPAAVESVRYTTAKLVLLGDSGVGKTGLGWRLSHPDFKEHESTHGQQFWVMDTLKAKRTDGAECETVLWDLAGQHVYRPVHSIFLDRVDLALVVFDPTNRQESLKGVEFWLDQLSGRGALPPAVLVGARLDRGSSVLPKADLDQFCQRRGISGGYVATSAKSGDGLDTLIRILEENIHWDKAAATVTTSTFKRIKDYVLALKEATTTKDVLISPDRLQQRLAATDPTWRFEPAEMMTAVGHLENHGYVAVLRSSASRQFILLAPTLLPDLASSIFLQADKHPRELGAVSETLLLEGGYSFPELKDLARSERETLIDATVVRFLSHNLCFRETLGAETLLIFPSLIKLKRPLHDDVETVDGVSYVVRGRVENLYAAFAVLLGYTQTFGRVSQWQNQAQYEFEKGQICGFRMLQEREGELEFVLYYAVSTPAYGRALFQGLFEKFLYERDVQVSRFDPVACPNGHPQERAAVVQRRREGKTFLFCSECGLKIPLPEGDAPSTVGPGVSRQVAHENALARLRSAYEAHLARVKAFRRDRVGPRCYLSHTGHRPEWTAELLRGLLDAGVYIVERPEDLTADDFVLVVWNTAYTGPSIVQERLRLEREQRRLIPLLLVDADAAALPPEFGDAVVGDFRDQTRYVLSLLDLVLPLYSLPLLHPAFAGLRHALQVSWEQIAGSGGGAAPREVAHRQVFVSYAWEPESEKMVRELDKAFRDAGVTIVQDKRDLGFKGEIREFMEDIGRGKCVLLVLSDKYLQSENCLFELLQVAKHGEFKDRVFPVVLESARIYKPLDRIRYVQYWEKQIGDLDAALKTVSAANLQGFREEIDLYSEIRAALPKLADILKNINALTPQIHRESNFADLVNAVLSRLPA